MGANLSGNNIDNGDFMIKTCAADPEAGYAKEKFHADPKNGIIISEVDGAKGKQLEFSADWSVVSLDTKLKEGENIEINKDQQTGKVEISAPDVGKVLVDSNDTTLKYLDDAITSSDNSIQHEASSNLEDLTVPDLGKVKYNDEFLNLAEGDGISLDKNGTDLKISATNNGKVLVNSSDANADFLGNKIEVYFPLQKRVKHDNSQLQITVANKLNFAQFYAKWNNNDYDKSDISYYYEYTAMLGKIQCDTIDLLGVCFVLIQGNPLTLDIRYTATSDVDCILYYRSIGDLSWNSQSVTLSNSSGELATTSFAVPATGDTPLEFLLVCEEETGNAVVRIFEIYAD